VRQLKRDVCAHHTQNYAEIKMRYGKKLSGVEVYNIASLDRTYAPQVGGKFWQD